MLGVDRAPPDRSPRGVSRSILMVAFNYPARAARDGKKVGEKSSRNNSLRRSMPALLGRWLDRRRCVADGVRDGSWSR